ncbi:dihydroxyacetone kinase phosphoryl donor subunit DhaM [Halorhabdus rudnickae]|uniref:dihydroxyacetone kinase phosphoryl donor subunit DhaM n=1 Tax=Halorhabdus rudnickae TaxID=1775544 RepID=UPI001082AF21|nr:dihydroxyacetone kinase phosphoryl donor subunit DhaM [Halorhabdus rudnickae]
MVGLVVVSHSQRAAEGIAEVASEMGGDTHIEPVGGDGHGGFGTVADDIEAALEAADSGDGVVVLVDLGSAVMNAEVAVETSDVDAVIADAPVLEGAVNAAVAATSPKATVDSVREQAEAAREIAKL